MNVHLPIADRAQTWSELKVYLRRHRRALLALIGFQTLAAFAGLAGPQVLGNLVNHLDAGTLTAHLVDVAVAILAAALILQTVFTWITRRIAYTWGEQVFAELRESFLGRLLDLPLSTVEQAGTGDLLSRTTNDMDAIAQTVRFAVPEFAVGIITVIVTIVWILVLSPPMIAAALAGLPLLIIGTRWYLHRAPLGYRNERASYSTLSGTLAETANGGRTIEALGLADRQRDRFRSDLATCYFWERRNLYFRCVWFPFIDLGMALPMLATLGLGAVLVDQGKVSIGLVTTITLLVQQLTTPLDKMLRWLDELLIGTTSLSRLFGVGAVESDRTSTGADPGDETIAATDVRYAYREGHDVLNGISLTVTPGERLAVVGPSGAGKSTLGRLLVGIDGPRRGSIDVGGVPLLDLTLDELRGHVALVTQEHHVFIGTVADNIVLTRPDATLAEVEASLAAVDALEWVHELPHGLATEIGTTGYPLSASQAQQLALARLVLADPHTLVLDEATSLLDPRAARHLERSLSAVVQGRTVVAIAHRLHTAHDADRVAVVDHGEIIELGTHDELLAEDGSYAALWRSWRDER